VSDYIKRLSGVIFKLHGCDAKHVGTIHVHEKFQDRTVWEGDVEYFALKQHPKSLMCYAWSYFDDAGVEQFSTVLEVPPVFSAEDAVRAALIAQVKREGKET
jgi:hypothetical protein